ncbi:MAG: Xylose ABC transporter, permease protein XylH, partial [uncultured Blastococcus sp.]
VQRALRTHQRSGAGRRAVGLRGRPPSRLGRRHRPGLRRPGPGRRPRRAARDPRHRGPRAALLRPAAGDLPHPAQHGQPRRPGRADHHPGDGAGLRPAARGDRPVGGRRQRRLRRRHGEAARRCRRTVVRLRGGGGPDRSRHRAVHRQPRGTDRDPLVRRHPGAVPGLAGLHAAADRRGRHGAGARPGDLRDQRPERAGDARLDPRPRGHRALRRAAAQPVAHPEGEGAGALAAGRRAHPHRRDRRGGPPGHRGAQRGPGPGHRCRPRGHPLRRPAGHPPAAVPDLRAGPHQFRTPRVRRRWQRRGGPARRHRRHEDQGVGVRHRVEPGGDQRHRRRRPARVGGAGLRRWQHAAVRGRRRGHRRHQPLRWARPGAGRRPRRPGGGHHRQRPGSARHGGVPELHHHRWSPAAGRERRRARPATGGGDRSL